MLSIQDVGLEILEHRPRKFYVFVGQEYGIKLKYIDLIAENYKGSILYPKTVSSVLDMMNVKHFFPLPPSVYVVRYDLDFLTSLNDALVKKIEACNIIGTLVCIYESDKDVQKLSKYLGDYTVSIDKVNPRFVKNYLKTDFPEITDKLIDSAIKASNDYNQAKNICNCMMHAQAEHFYAMTDREIVEMFGYKRRSAEDEIKLSVARRSFPLFLRLLDMYTESLDSVLYMMLSVMLEMEKVLTSKFAESNYRAYEKLWSLEDVYNFFMQIYQELKRSRSYASYDLQNGLIRLGVLMHSNKIPAAGGD